jgi:hydrogenase-4 component B
MITVIVSLIILAGGGVLSACLASRPSRATTVAWVSNLIGGTLGLVAALSGLLGGDRLAFRMAWSIPGGALHLEMDPLSAFFLVPIFLLGMLGAFYGVGYLRNHSVQSDLGPAWFFYNTLIVSMAVVVLARNAVLFLLAWETMALASFFLVTLEHHKAEVRSAGWTYMVATHLGTAFLLALFAILGQKAGSLDFADFGRAGAALPASLTSLLFVFAVIGFGTKAGFMPMHVWLPDAHPAAPSHVSAVMSGVMIKTGIYGLLRVLTCLGVPPAWWGWSLVAIGLVSGVLGVLFALAQHDLKRLLAYHSVENIGIIALGIGVGLIGLSSRSPAIAVLGFGGALLHVLNHAVFKGLLFLGAGAVLHATGTRDIEHLGGLLKRMPWTGATFLVGAVAICGLPPLNGFISEFLIYMGAFRGVRELSGAPVVALLGVVVGLALIGGLAVACFTKAFGIVFLGEPRSDAAAHGHEPPPAMLGPMIVLACGCLTIGLAAPLFVRATGSAIGVLVNLPNAPVHEGLGTAISTVSWIAAGSLAFLGLAALLAWLRWRLVGRYPVGQTVTWDCGYARPTPRMQYTASSFAQPLLYLFRVFLRPRTEQVPPEGPFPQAASLRTETLDVFRDLIYQPLFRGVAGLLARVQTLQHGRVQVYVLYLTLTLMALLVFYLR